MLKALQIDYFTCYLILHRPGLWQVKSRGRFTRGCESGGENTHEGELRGPGWDLAPRSPACRGAKGPAEVAARARKPRRAANLTQHHGKQHLQILKCCHCPCPSVPFPEIKPLLSV